MQHADVVVVNYALHYDSDVISPSRPPARRVLISSGRASSLHSRSR